MPDGHKLEEITNDNSPQVSTTEELDTVPETGGGRFVSNTYSYVTAGDTSATNAPTTEKFRRPSRSIGVKMNREFESRELCGKILIKEISAFICLVQSKHLEL